MVGGRMVRIRTTLAVEPGLMSLLEGALVSIDQQIEKKFTKSKNLE